MSLPTRQWSVLSGTLGIGARAAIPHGIRTGQYPNGVVPNAVWPILESAAGFAAISLNIAPYAAMDATNVYLSNYSPNGQNGYHVMVRRYHSVDGNNL